MDYPSSQPHADAGSPDVDNTMSDAGSDEDGEIATVESMLDAFTDHPKDDSDGGEEDVDKPFSAELANTSEIHNSLPTTSVADHELDCVALSDSLQVVVAAMNTVDDSDGASSYERCSSVDYLADCEGEDNSDAESMVSAYTLGTQDDEYEGLCEEQESMAMDSDHYEASAVGAPTPYAVSEYDGEDYCATMSSMGDASWGNDVSGMADVDYVPTPRALSPVSGYDGSFIFSSETCAVAGNEEHAEVAAADAHMACSIDGGSSASEPTSRASSPIEDVDLCSDTTEDVAMDETDTEYQSNQHTLTITKQRTLDLLTGPIMRDATYADEDPNTLITSAYGTTDSDFEFSDDDSKKDSGPVTPAEPRTAHVQARVKSPSPPATPTLSSRWASTRNVFQDLHCPSVSNHTPEDEQEAEKYLLSMPVHGKPTLPPLKKTVSTWLNAFENLERASRAKYQSQESAQF